MSKYMYVAFELSVKENVSCQIKLSLSSVKTVGHQILLNRKDATVPTTMVTIAQRGLYHTYEME